MVKDIENYDANVKLFWGLKFVLGGIFFTIFLLGLLEAFDQSLDLYWQATVVIGVVITGLLLQLASYKKHVNSECLGFLISVSELKAVTPQQCAEYYESFGRRLFSLGVLSFLSGLLFLALHIDDPNLIGPVLALALVGMGYGVVGQVFFARVVAARALNLDIEVAQRNLVTQQPGFGQAAIGVGILLVMVGLGCKVSGALSMYLDFISMLIVLGSLVSGSYLTGTVRLGVNPLELYCFRGCYDAQDARNASKFFETMMGINTMAGILGTLVGLVVILSNLSDWAAIGPGLAVALLTTLYCVLFRIVLIGYRAHYEAKAEEFLSGSHMSRAA